MPSTGAPGRSALMARRSASSASHQSHQRWNDRAPDAIPSVRAGLIGTIFRSSARRVERRSVPSTLPTSFPRLLGMGKIL